MAVVFFFLPETSGKSLEEIDTMFLMRVKPWKSSKWQLGEGETLTSNDRRASEAHATRRASRASGGGWTRNSSAQVPPTRQVMEKDYPGGTEGSATHVR